MFETGESDAPGGDNAAGRLTASDLERLLHTYPAPADRQFELSTRLRLGDHHSRDPRRVVAVGETATVTPELIGAVWEVVPSELDRDGRIGLSVSYDRAMNAMAARRAVAVAATMAATPEVPGWMPAEQVAAGDLGAALHLGAGGADDLLDVSVTLGQRLPDTLAAVSRGDLSWGKAATLAHAIASLTDAQGRAVEARVLPHAATRTPAQHQAAVRRAVDTIDPAGADERRREARKDVMLARQHLGNGMGELYGRMTSEQVDIIWAGADHWARRRKAAGDPRTLDQLRVAALVNWASSFLTHDDASYCDRVCNTGPADTEATSSEAEPAAPPVRHGRAAVVAV